MAGGDRVRNSATNRTETTSGSHWGLLGAASSTALKRIVALSSRQLVVDRTALLSHSLRPGTDDGNGSVR
jgi:hypothetical protein